MESKADFLIRSRDSLKEYTDLINKSSSKGRAVFPAAQGGTQPLQRPDLFGTKSVDLEGRILLQIEAIRDKAMRLDDEYDSMKEENLERCLSFIDFINDSEESAQREIDATCAEHISRFKIEDPYVLCAGLLYPVDTDSDLPCLPRAEPDSRAGWPTAHCFPSIFMVKYFIFLILADSRFWQGERGTWLNLHLVCG